MKTIRARVGWTKRMVTYIDMEVDDDFDGEFTEEQRLAAISEIDYQSEEWIDEESYDHTVEVIEE
ncbi:MAG: hypothetical protein J7K40_12200 [candidate division Zixibacteria bacterium]|nr:hypothetical protein [candidate division Zixibacteria bacterium]